MSGAIRRIIAEIAPRTSATVVCPWCDGGSRKRRTLSIDLRDGVWLWICHRPKCNEKGALAAGGEIRTRPVAPFEPKVLDWALRLPEPSDPIGARVARLIERPLRGFALRHGLRVSEDDPTGHAWIIRDLAGAPFGHVTRDADKNVLTWRIRDAAIYGAFKPEGAQRNVLAVVEDPLSAALLAEDGFTAIAVLSDSMQASVAQEIAGYARSLDLPVFVIPDPDDAGIRGAARTSSRLEAGGAPWVAQWWTPRDVKDLTRAERGAMLGAMEAYEWLN